MHWYSYPLLIFAGIASGFVNMLAGNGSLITLPALIYAGLPAGAANATNRVGVTLQNIVGVVGFHRQGALDLRGSLIFSIPTVAGSIAGALLAVDINEAIFRHVLAVVMLIMLVVMLVNPERWVTGKIRSYSGRVSPTQFLIFFAIGIYGGFLQAGVGIFLLAGLVLGPGYDVVRANAVKVAIVFTLTLASLIVFQANAMIRWMPGLVLGAGNMLGAWVGTHVAVSRGAVWVRWFVIVVVVISAAHLLGVLERLGRLFV